MFEDPTLFNIGLAAMNSQRFQRSFVPTEQNFSPPYETPVHQFISVILIH